MEIINLVAGLLGIALVIFQGLLWVYFGLNIFSAIRPDWRPQGAVLYLADVTYRVVDPPLRFVRKFIPPLDLGAIKLDLAWMVLFFATIILQGFVSSLPALFV